MKTVRFEGRAYTFPDDASDDEIAEALERDSDPKSTRPDGYHPKTGRDAARLQAATLNFSDEIFGAGAGLFEGVRKAVATPGSVQERASAGVQAAQQAFGATAERERALVAQHNKENPGLVAQLDVALPSLVGGGAITGALKAAGVKHLAANTLASGAAAGAAAGAGSGASIDERAGNAVRGAARGGLEAGAFGAGGWLGGQVLGTIAKVLTRSGLTPDDRAVRLIARMMDDAKVSPQEFVSRSAKAQNAGEVEEMMFELLGESGRRAARALYSVKGPSAQQAQDAFDLRRSEVGQRVTKAAAKAAGLPKNTSMGDFLEKLRAARRVDADGAYAAAYAEAIPDDIFTRDLRPFMLDSQVGRPAVAHAAKLANADLLRLRAELSGAQRAGNDAASARVLADIANAEQSLAALQAMRAGQDVRSAPVRSLDYFQRGLRSLSEKAGRGTQLGSAIEKARTEFNTLLDLDAPKFGSARTSYGESVRQEDLVEAGRKVFETDDFEVASIAEGLTGTADKDAFMVGVMRAIADKVNRGETAFVARLSRDKNLRNQLVEAFGGDTSKARQFLGRVTREASMASSDNFVRAGSRTAPLQEDIRALTDGDDELSFIADVLASGGSVRPLLLRKAGEAYQRFRQPGIRNREVNAALGRRLFDQATRPRAAALAAEVEASHGARSDRLIEEYQRALAGVGAAAGVGYAGSRNEETAP